jgi:Holliday junction resolvase
VSGKRHRIKGSRIELEIVKRHQAIGVHSERYPLSGASRFRGSGHDIDVYAFGKDEAPLVAEVKGRKTGNGFKLLEKWLGSYDALFLRQNHADPLVVLPWDTWRKLVVVAEYASRPGSLRRRSPDRLLQDGNAGVQGASVLSGISSDQRAMSDDLTEKEH